MRDILLKSFTTLFYYRNMFDRIYYFLCIFYLKQLSNYAKQTILWSVLHISEFNYDFYWMKSHVSLILSQSRFITNLYLLVCSTILLNSQENILNDESTNVNKLKIDWHKKLVYAYRSIYYLSNAFQMEFSLIN